MRNGSALGEYELTDVLPIVQKQYTVSSTCVITRLNYPYYISNTFKEHEK